MVKDKKLIQFLKGSSILVVANIALKAINFFLLPLYTDHLNPEELGVSDLVSTMTAFLLPLLIMGLDSAFSAYFYEEKNIAYINKLFNTIWFTIFCSSLVSLFFILFSDNISFLLFQTTDYKLLVAIALLSVSVNMWHLPFSLLLRMQNKMGTFGIINVISSLILIILNVIFIAYLQLSAYSLITSIFISQIVQLIIYYLASKMKISYKLVDKDLRKKLLKFALPLVPTVVAVWVLNMSDRFLLKSFLGDISVGLYGISARFSSLLAIISSAVYTAYSAYAYSKRHDSNAKSQFKKILNSFFVLLFGLCFVTSLFGRELILLMTNPSYESAYLVLPGILFGQLMYGVNVITSYGISFEKKTIYLLISTVVGATVSVVLNIIFIPKFGFVVAGHVNFISYVTMCALGYYYAQKIYPCDYGIVRISVISLIGYVVVLLTREIYTVHKVFVALVCVSIGIFIFRDVFKDFRNIFKQLLKKEV